MRDRLHYELMRADELFTLPSSLPFQAFFKDSLAPWEWVQQIAKALESTSFPKLETPIPAGLSITGPVYIHPSVKLPPYGSIQGPCYIGAQCQLRPGVFIRGQVIVGENCVLGNACEFKNCMLLDQVQVPHFSYVGDSILGNRSHLGAGVICSNLRLDQKAICVTNQQHVRIQTGMRKLGALLGDGAEIGCNTVLNPGVIVAPNTHIFPAKTISGFMGASGR